MGTSESPRIVVGLGELLWDCFPTGRLPGGAPANVAFHAEQLGCRGIICSRVGCDDLGDELCELLAEQGLDTTYVQRDSMRPTGTVTVDTTQPGDPDFVIHENVAWDALEFDSHTEDLFSNAAAVCFGTLAQRSATSRRTILRCLEATAADCLVVYDVNLRQDWYRREWIDASLGRAGIVKLNSDEAVRLTQLLEIGSSDYAEFADSLRTRYGVGLTCITRAEQGCQVATPDETINVDGVDVQVADAVGAGDAFTAALIAGLLDGWPLSNSAKFANHVGALVAGRPGAMPALRDEFAELRSQCAPPAS